MLAALIIGSVISCDLLIGVSGQRMLGSGTWSVVNADKCPNDADMPWPLRVRRHKVNRTHDAFDVEFDVGDDIDDTNGVCAEVCKMVDGGCKPYMTLSDDSLPNFVRKYGNGENIRMAFENAGIDPPDFPIPKGQQRLKDFVIDMNDLPEEGVYGTFGADVYVLKDGQQLACTHVLVKYEPKDDSPYG